MQIFKKIKRVLPVALVSATLMFGGCCTIFGIGCPPKPLEKADDPLAVSSRINETVNRMEANSLQIEELGEETLRNINDIHSKLPDEPSVDSARDNVNKIKVLNQQTLKEVPSVENDAILVSVFSKTISDLQDIINKYEDEMYQKQQAIWLMVNTLAAIGLISAIFIAIYWKPSYGFSLGGGCLATIAVSTFMGSHIIMVAWVGGGILLIILAVFVYKVLRENINVKQAFKESVVTTEVSKFEKWNPKISKKVDAIQSPLTKKMVQEVKDDLKKKGYYNLPKKAEDNTNIDDTPNTDETGKKNTTVIDTGGK